VGLVGNILSAIVKAFFVIITMYYLFRDGDRILQNLPGVLPLNAHQSEAIIARTSQVVSASVYGVVTIAMLQGMLGGLAFWLFGVPSPILWGVVLAFVCMIPIAGSFFVWLPASIYLILTGHWTKGILLILWGALVISTIDNFLRPKLIKNQTKLHELFVFFSVLGGMSVFGLLGIVLGPVVLAITLGLLQAFKRENDEAQYRETGCSFFAHRLSNDLTPSQDEVMTK
jgi:predicted PurR-regulated permease PerM